MPQFTSPDQQNTQAHKLSISHFMSIGGSDLRPDRYVKSGDKVLRVNHSFTPKSCALYQPFNYLNESLCSTLGQIN